MKRMEFLFTLLFVLHVYHDALGQQQVWAYVGDESVSLPCIMEPLGSMTNLSVEWTRDWSEEVHLKVSDGDDLRKQSSAFRDRTQMNLDALQTGNLTLFLLRPNIRDSGVYTCVARASLTKVGSTSVDLKVEVRPQQSPVIEKEAVLKGIGGFVVAVIVLCIICEPFRNVCVAICGCCCFCTWECCKCCHECCCECCMYCQECCCCSRSQEPQQLDGLH